MNEDILRIGPYTIARFPKYTPGETKYSVRHKSGESMTVKESDLGRLMELWWKELF